MWGGIEDKIRDGELTSEELQILSRIVSENNGPLAVRSSAVGDCRGTGVYRTEFSDCSVERLGKKVKEVLASYFSRDAVLFRRDAKTGDGFAIMVEPLVGQKIESADEYEVYDTFYAPLLSGFGYTSTSRGEGYVNVVPGLGGGVDTRNGERITRTALQDFENLGVYIYETAGKMFGLFRETTVRHSALLHTIGGRLDLDHLCKANFYRV